MPYAAIHTRQTSHRTGRLGGSSASASTACGRVGRSLSSNTAQCGIARDRDGEACEADRTAQLSSPACACRRRSNRGPNSCSLALTCSPFFPFLPSSLSSKMYLAARARSSRLNRLSFLFNPTSKTQQVPLPSARVYRIQIQCAGDLGAVWAGPNLCGVL